MEVKKYRKKPVVIEAIQLHETTMQKIYDWMGITDKGGFLVCRCGIDPADGNFKITTLDAIMVVNKYDYIVKGVKGGFYSCSSEIFEKIHEEVLDNELTIFF